jgi:hypothetical protein
MKLIGLALSLLTVIGSGYWSYIEGGFGPGITFLTSLSAVIYLIKNDRKVSATPDPKETAEHAHDKIIISDILKLLPYENTKHWLNQAHLAGLRCDFTHDLDSCEKYNDPPHTIYNNLIEEKKVELVKAIRIFNIKCLDFLGAQDNPSGDMYTPHYYLKNRSETKDKYYELQKEVSDAARSLLHQYDEFIKHVKSEGFIIERI